jgi:hypothetical protein
MSDAEVLRSHAERIRASGVLGRSELTRRLFDFLLDCTLAGRSPKEIEVAVDVFQRSATFDVTQDAMVRVYVHKLRRKLGDFYTGPGRDEPVRMVIPKGVYRFSLERVEAPASPKGRPRRSGVNWLVGALALSVLVNLGLIGFSAYRPSRPPDELHQARDAPLWSRMLTDDRTIFIVLGDYYIFGETNRSMELKRLIREFSINSPGDLEQYVSAHPEFADRYLDLNLGYLPTSTAFALREVMPVVASSNRRIRVALASELSPAVLTSADVIYIGYLSGMGMLHDLVFAGSRFQAGDTYDEVVDRSTGTHYFSQAAVQLPGNDKYHDYGYVASLTGPSGNEILIIAGTRDVALMHVAETLTKPPSLDELRQRSGNAQSFEALYDVYGMDRMNIGGKLLITSKLDTSKIWTGESARPVAPEASPAEPRPPNVAAAGSLTLRNDAGQP